MSNNNLPKINKQITAKEVRVIDQEGKMLGVMALNAALDLAENLDLDLVEVASTSVPPVCKILDFSKMKGDIKKRHKEAKRKQKATVMKEAPALSYNIAAHDLGIRIRNIESWLKDGHKVKITVKFKGREIAYLETGISLLKKVLEDTQELAKVEMGPTLQGKNLTVIIIPLKRKTAT